MASVVPSKSSIISIYRQLLYYTGLTGAGKQIKLDEIRTTFRENRTITDPQQIIKCFDTAQKKLKFLKVITPRSPRSHKVAGKYVYEDGKLIQGQGEAKSKSKYKDQGIDIMDYNRHQHLLKRQHFGGR
ncbi:LYR motif-containing protein [Heterostelium album PN500]|uniref:LYR motif-containing protein n=1 Tax=Heterostelium pallidum (strain ATCC 26659 / Pp 5 / PN500) TaxID=670386 RepID=D3AY84_HETP5|nr:LYR motif-containing protein [Heterostelium album PN500]EFA85911.1 LYR motif-containing protein [Heterostelium album PN500]|eukprot:XP_020438017.1 LYR motif-containing protein [Heterostelium album PN500]